MQLLILCVINYHSILKVNMFKVKQLLNELTTCLMSKHLFNELTGID